MTAVWFFPMFCDNLFLMALAASLGLRILSRNLQIHYHFEIQDHNSFSSAFFLCPSSSPLLQYEENTCHVGKWILNIYSPTANLGRIGEWLFTTLLET
jgi:hypothetical protein